MPRFGMMAAVLPRPRALEICRRLAALDHRLRLASMTDYAPPYSMSALARWTQIMRLGDPYRST